MEGRENGRSSLEIIPVESARPSPIVPEIADSLFDEVTATPIPSNTATGAADETPSRTPSPEEISTPEEAPSATPSEPPALTPVPVSTPDSTSLEYQVVNLSGEPTPSPTPTTAPTPTPYLTPDPDAMTFEED